MTGASISIIVFSERRRAAPSVTMRRAAASSILPSRIKCCLRTSGRGRSVRGSNTSATVSLCDGGKSTSVNNEQQYIIIVPTINASIVRLIVKDDLYFCVIKYGKGEDSLFLSL